jgi:dolichol-phosphate mannosyltransferase
VITERHDASEGFATPAQSRAKKPQRVCVISPCYNEEEVVELFHRELRSAMESLTDVEYAILFVDDGSTDGTIARLNAIAAGDPHVRVCSLSRNFGHQIALSAGLDHARGDAVIFLDSDLQHPPRLIPELIDVWRKGAEVVLTVREETADSGWFKRFSSKAFYYLFNQMADVKLVCGAADFCLLSRQVYRALRGMPERHRFLRGMIAWAGYPRSVVSYKSPPRAAGKSKYTLVRMLKLAAEAVFSFTARPIYLAIQLGALSVLAGFLYLAFILFGNLFYPLGFVPGWSSVISLILLLGGFQLLTTGLVGSYIARIFEQVKNRPMYLLKQSPRRFFARSRRQTTRPPYYLIKKELAPDPSTEKRGEFPTYDADARKTA